MGVTFAKISVAIEALVTKEVLAAEYVEEDGDLYYWPKHGPKPEGRCTRRHA